MSNRDAGFVCKLHAGNFDPSEETWRCVFWGLVVQRELKSCRWNVYYCSSPLLLDHFYRPLVAYIGGIITQLRRRSSVTSTGRDHLSARLLPSASCVLRVEGLLGLFFQWHRTRMAASSYFFWMDAPNYLPTFSFCYWTLLMIGEHTHCTTQSFSHCSGLAPSMYHDAQALPYAAAMQISGSLADFFHVRSHLQTCIDNSFHQARYSPVLAGLVRALLFGEINKIIDNTWKVKH